MDEWSLDEAGGTLTIFHLVPRYHLFVPTQMGFVQPVPDLEDERLTEIDEPLRMRIMDTWDQGAVQMGFGPWVGRTTFVLRGRRPFWLFDDDISDRVGYADEETSLADMSTRTGGSRSRSPRSRRSGTASTSASHHGRRHAQEAVDYIAVINGLNNPTAEEWSRVLRAGNKLLEAAGTVEEAAKWLWSARADYSLANLHKLEDQALDGILHPDLLAYLRHVKREGMQARHVGERQRVQAQPHPTARRNMSQVYKQIWKDVKKHRVLVASSDCKELGATMASPFDAVAKMMPDRSISQEVRVVHDQRQINLGTHKDLHPPALQPTHDQIARRILFMKRRYPGLPVLMAKKDIAGAFRLLWVAPADVELFAGELPWQEDAMEAGECPTGEADHSKTPFTVLYLVSSFGFAGSPGEWTPWGRATEEFHRAHNPGHPRRDGACGFECKTLVDDAVLVEPWMGHRPWTSAACYETGVKQLLGGAAVNKEKDAIEGAFKEEQVVWGLAMNTRTEKAFLPERRILKGAHLIGDVAFDVGERRVTLRQMQQFRGIMTGWATVVRGLNNELKAADVFLGPGDGSSAAKPRGLGYRDADIEVQEAWEDLWELFEVCRWLCARSDRWEMRFGATLNELLPIRERLCLPGEWTDTVFVSSDATTTVIGAIDWTGRAVARSTMEDLLPWLRGAVDQESDPDEGVRIHLAEMLSLVAFVCERGEQWRGRVVLYAGDNTTVRQWVTRRQSGSRAGRLLIRVLNLCEMNYHIKVIGAWWRTYHNVDSDFVTRCEKDDFDHYAKAKGWQVIELGPAIEQAIRDSERFGACFLSWSEPEDRKVMMQLKEQRVRRFVDRPIPISWETIQVKEWGAQGRRVFDFYEVGRRLGGTEGSKRKVLASTFPVDAQGFLARKFLQTVVEWTPEVVIAEGPSCSRWDIIEQGLDQGGFYVYHLDFISTELGEALARRRRCLIGTTGPIDESLVNQCLVRAVTAVPLSSVVGEGNQDQEEYWYRPAKLEVNPGAPRNPLLPLVVGHWWDEDGQRHNLHGLNGPGRWPLQGDRGEYEVLYAMDRKGKPGCIRRLSPVEVWRAQGRCDNAWAALRQEGLSEVEIYREGNRATGMQVAASLLVLAGAVVDFQTVVNEVKAGALAYEPKDQSMTKLLAWLRRWKRGALGELARELGPSRAGGSSRERQRSTQPVSRGGEAMWIEALEDNTNEEEGTRAGGRKNKAAVAAAESALVLYGPGQPFDGEVSGRVDDWLEANMQGDKAQSTAKVYLSAWSKWEAWARRQQWESAYLDVRGDKLTNENKLLAFLGYLGWLGTSPASIKQALFAIKDAHKRAGAGDPTEGMFRVWMLMGALDRHADRKPRRLGVTPGMLVWIGKNLQGDPSLMGEDRVDARMLQAALLTAWFFMMRIREYADSGGVDKDMVLRGADVRLTRDGTDVDSGANEITIQFRKTKADQEAFGSSKTMGLTGVEFLCPVVAMENLRSSASRRFGQGPEALLPLFRWSNGLTLKRAEVQAILQRSAKATGLPADRFMSHSLRIGGASALYQASGEIELVKRMGRWSSSAVQKYLFDGGEVLKNLSGKMARVEQRVHYT